MHPWGSHDVRPDRDRQKLHPEVVQMERANSTATYCDSQAMPGTAFLKKRFVNNQNQDSRTVNSN